MSIVKAPILLDLGGRRREVRFTLRTEGLIADQMGSLSNYWETIGEYVDEEGKTKRRLRLNRENFIVYLWASLQGDAARHNELLSVDDVEAMLDHRKKSDAALDAVGKALIGYYGDEDPSGEASARA